MNDPSPSSDAADIMTVVHEAVGGLELKPAEKREVWRFTWRELPYFWSQRISYFILGNYRDPYIRQLHAVQSELMGQFGVYPFVIGGLIGLPADRLSTFDVMSSLLATYNDYIVGVFEKKSGGEAPELGEIDDPPYFEKSYVYPRDYSWVTDARLESKHHAIQAVLKVAFTDDLAKDEVASKIKSLLECA